MTDGQDQSGRLPTLDEALAAGGIIEWRQFVVLVNNGLPDGEEKLAKVGGEFVTYARAMRERERFLPDNPSARVFEIFRYYHLDVPTQRAQFERAFRAGEKELLEFHG